MSTSERRGFLKALGSIVVGVASLPLVRHTAWAGKVEDAVFRERLAKKTVLPREYVMGLGRTTVQPGELVRVRVPSGFDFKPERLVIPSTIADLLVIEDLRFCNVRQLGTDVPVPAAVFSEVAFGVRLNEREMIFVRKGRFIEIAVRNPSAVPVDFVGALVGQAIEDSPHLYVEI